MYMLHRGNRDQEIGKEDACVKNIERQQCVNSVLTLIRMTKDEKGLAFFKGLLL